MKTLLFKITGCCALIIFAGATCSTKETEGDGSTPSVTVQNLASGLNHPWGMAFLPDGRLLVTEREGTLRIMGTDNSLSDPIAGVPEVFSEGQGGMLDVAIHPQFESNGYVYLSFSEPQGDNASTALGRGKLENDQLKDFTVIFRQEPKVEGPNHFGGRIVFSSDGHLFLTMGERFKFDPAQDVSNHLGTIVRLTMDGSVPSDNPLQQQNARPEIWSYGHRNIEAAAFEPNTNRLWIAEMGPQGGDELNLVEAGKNYGWPIVSWGEHYDGKDIPDPTTRPEFQDAATHWTPVISPSGMAFYTGDMFPEFKGNMLIGGLSAKAVVRVKVTGNTAEEIGRIDLNARIRDVEQAPDGSIYVLTDQASGNVWRLVPNEKN